MEKFLVLICLAVGLQVVTSQSPAPGSCIHFLYPRQAANCLPFANCSGAQCNITHTRGRASFVVHKCQDPVTVDLSVVTGNSVFHRQFNHSESTNAPGFRRVIVRMSRNDTHLQFEVTGLIQGDIMTMFIPTVIVPLNPRACMCQSLQSVAQDTQLPSIPIQFSCTRNTTCNRINCHFSNYAFDMTFDPCSEAIQMTAYDSDGRPVYQRTFNDSQNVTFNLPSTISSFLGQTATLNVIIVHHNYSMELEASLVVNLLLVGRRTVEVLRRHTIILDKSNCSNATSLPPPTSSPHSPSPPTSSPHSPSPPTSSPHSSSPPTSSPHSSSPPTSSPHSPSPPTSSPHSPSPPTSSPPTSSPHSPSPPTSSPHSSSPPTSFPHSPSPPTSSPASSQTCQALRNLASSNRLCNTTHSCTTVECLVLNYHAAMTVLPCHTPPALRVVVHNATGGVLYNETLTQSRTIHEGFITLNVTVEHVSNEAIVVKVDLVAPVPLPLLPRTTIPIDRSHCSGYTPLPPPSTLPPKHSHTHPPPHPPTTHTHIHTMTLLPHPSTTHTPIMHTFKTPLPTTSPSNNCPVLSQLTELLRRGSFTCEFSATCDQAECSRGEGNIILMLLPCNNPPGFRLIFWEGDSISQNYTFTHSEVVPFLDPAANITLNVTLDYTSDSAMEVKVVYRSIYGPTTIIPHTVVQLDRSSCPTVGSQLVVAVVTPLVVVLCLVVGVVLVVVAVVVLRRKKRSQFHFTRMKLSEVTED